VELEGRGGPRLFGHGDSQGCPSGSLGSLSRFTYSVAPGLPSVLCSPPAQSPVVSVGLGPALGCRCQGTLRAVQL
jgi:hypothetical protein